MIETALLLPLEYGDGGVVEVEAWEQLELRLLRFDGFSRNQDVQGVWRDAGRIHRDVSRQYLVALASWTDMPAWLEVVRWARQRFRQDAVYVRVAGIVEILRL